MISINAGNVSARGILPELVLETCCCMASTFDKMKDELGEGVALAVFSEMGKLAVTDADTSEWDELAKKIIKDITFSKLDNVGVDSDVAESLLDAIEKALK